MLPFVQIGPAAVQVPGLVLLLGLFGGLFLAERQAPRHGVNANDLYSLAFTALVAGAVGARLVYVFRYPAAFAASPLSVISLNPGLLDLWGGLAAALIAAVVYGQRKRMALWSTLDALVPFLSTLIISQGLADLAAGTAFGAPTRLPWGIELWGEHRHPTQIYYILAGAFILLATWPGSQLLPTGSTTGTASQHHQPVPGSRFLVFMILASAAYLFIEAFRGDSLLSPGGFRTIQWIAWLVLAASLWGLGRLLTATGNSAS